MSARSFLFSALFRPHHLGMAVLGLALLVSCASSGPPSANLPKGPVALRYRGYSGQWRTLSALRGKPVVVAVIATWAGPALVEVERLQAISRIRSREVALVVLVLDEETEMAAIFAETFGLPEAVGRVENSARFAGNEGPFGPIAVVPTGILLDAEGRIALRSDGPWPTGVLQKALDSLLAKKRRP